jgi:aryl-alcohol dehydrogenase-like predicted oxidoreductase
MLYRRIGTSDVDVSVLGLGGHEYLPNGSSRGFNEDAKRAVTPGYLFDGFGNTRRQRVLAAAFEHGINILDATIDSEKEALGRNLQEIVPPYPVYIQTRPEGMVYTYDPYNVQMAQYNVLRAEVVRILGLLKRERLEFLNIAPMASALERDPDYLAKIRDNVLGLKDEGLIRFACADTFSGEVMYLKEIETGCFDAIYINFNFADDCGRHEVLPAARERGMAVFAREAFLKGVLFRMGEEVGLTDRGFLAKTALKWVLSIPEVTLAMVGVDSPEQMASNVAVLDDLGLNEGDRAVLVRLKTSPTYATYSTQKSVQFGCGA